MKRSYRNSGIISLLIVIIFIFAGCSPADPPSQDGPMTSTEAVAAGIQALKEGQWEEALDQFSLAIAFEPDNGEAQLWYSLLNIASIAVDDNLVELARNRLKFTDYPETMDALYSGDWINMDVYIFTDIEGKQYFCPYPPIQVPGEIAVLDDDNASLITPNEYNLALLYNFVTANPDGINELADKVVDELLGPRLDAAGVWLRKMSESAFITLTWDMFTDVNPAAVNWPLDENENPVSLKIGKAELLIEIAQLQIIRSLLSLCRSYNLTLPLAVYYNTFDPAGETNALAFPVSPFASGFLYGRAGAAEILNKARTSMLGALTDMLTALNGLISDRPGMIISSTSPLYAAMWEEMLVQLKYAKILCTKIKTSLKDNVTVILPIPGNVMTGEYFENYSNAANWPTVSDWVNPDTGLPEAIGINFNRIYSGTIFAIDSLLELQSGGAHVGEPVWYKCEYVITESDEAPYPASLSLYPAPMSDKNPINPLEDNVLYAFKIKDLTLGGLLDPDANFITNIKEIICSMTGDEDSGNYLVVENLDGSVSLYVPVVPPCFAYESFASAGETLAPEYSYLPAFNNYTTRGSFWWAVPDLYMLMASGMAMAM